MNFLATCIVTLAMLAGTDESQQQRKAFWSAAREGDLAAVERLLDAGVDVNAVTEFNCGAMYFAANRNQADVIRRLVEAGGDVNLRDTDYGFTPVQMAAWLGHTEATLALMEAGADPGDVVGSCFAAASNGHAATVAAMVDKLDLPAAQLNALWNTARQAGHPAVCQVLEEAGAEPQPVTDDEAPAEPASDPAPAFDFSTERAVPVVQAAPWPAFRGAGRNGIADGQHPPVAFDLEARRNVAWTTPVEGLGLSSPIIVGDRVFLTTAASAETRQTVENEGYGFISPVDEDAPHEWKVICLDLNTGQRRWESVASSGVPRSRRHWKASQANPTCVTDGMHLVASFGSQGIYCYDLDGNQRWAVDLGVLDSGWYIDSTFEWGFASSPVLYEDTVILQVDVHGDSYVAALRLKDGSIKWQTARTGELPSWGTPTVVRGPERDEVVLNASKAVRGYDAATGELLWEIYGNSPITAASPVTDGRLIVASGGYKTPQPIYVLRAGAAGDLTPPGGSGDAEEAEEGPEDPAEADADDGSPSSLPPGEGLVWSQETGGVYIVTPLVYRGLLYLCKNNGVLSVYDVESGERQYQRRLPTGMVTSSPVAADGRVYVVGESGTVVVLQAGAEYREIAVSELEASCLTTPAISNGMILFRTVRGVVAVAHEGGS